MSFKYCCITPKKSFSKVNTLERNPIGSDKTYMSLGDKIYKMIETGEDLGDKINPLYDGNDTDDLDVTKSFNHDAMDIAEEFGKTVDVLPNPLPDDNSTDDE